MNREELIFSLAEKIHEDLCMQEYQDYFNRANKIYKETSNLKQSLELGCFRYNEKQNEIVFNKKIVLRYPVLAACCLCDFVTFMKLIKINGLELKRNVKKNVTNVDGKTETIEENILTPFKNLSFHFRKEVLEISADMYLVFEQFSLAGYSNEHMLANEELRQKIGLTIHTNWLKRHCEDQVPMVNVSYSELDNEVKTQYLKFFDILLKIANNNKFYIEKIEDYKLPNYESLEQKILEKTK